MSKQKTNAKREAYARRQQEEGSKVVKWIFGVLIALAVVFAVYSCFVLA